MGRDSDIGHYLSFHLAFVPGLPCASLGQELGSVVSQAGPVCTPIGALSLPGSHRHSRRGFLSASQALSGYFLSISYVPGTGESVMTIQGQRQTETEKKKKNQTNAMANLDIAQCDLREQNWRK